MKRLRLADVRQMSLRAIVALLFVMVLAGCSTTTAEVPYSLTGVNWQWQNWTTGGTTTEVGSPENYTLMFNTDGTLNGVADCNNFGGTYTQESGGIQIQLGAMTLAACPEGSLDSTYLAALGQVVAGGNDGTGNLALENAGGETRMIFSNPDAAAATTSGGFLGLPWWLWLVGLALLGLLLWLLFGRSKPAPAPAPTPKPVAKPAAPPVAKPVETKTAPVAPKPVVTPDDLTKIEGIGPKINGVLQAAGIHTFVELSQSSTAELERILEASDIRGSYGDPTTWPAQAELAAAGEWEALQSMQDALKGGRVE